MMHHQMKAIWFFEQYEEVWTSWVSEEIAQKVKDAIAE